MSATPHTRFAGIDLLRAVACLAVVGFHYLSRGPVGGWMQGLDASLLEGAARYGYLGVHLFFLISGFVILYSASDATPRAFVASRVARLYPAYWVAVVLTVLVVWWGQDARLAVPLSHAIGNLSMFMHWLGLQYVDGAYWSLAVELHFYLYVWLVLRLGALRWLEALLAAWLVISLINWLRPMYPVEFWLSAKWAPFFAAGCVLFRLRSEGFSRARAALLVAAWLLATAYAVRDSAEGLAPGRPFNPVVVGALVTLMFAVMSALTQGWLRIAPSRFITLAGALTYPVYLLHENIGYVLHAALRSATGNAWLALVLVIAIVLAASGAIHRFVERPFAPRLKRLVLGRATQRPA